MRTLASQITASIVHSSVCWGADQRYCFSPIWMLRWPFKSINSMEAVMNLYTINVGNALHQNGFSSLWMPICLLIPPFTENSSHIIWFLSIMDSKMTVNLPWKTRAYHMPMIHFLQFGRWVVKKLSLENVLSYTQYWYWIFSTIGQMFVSNSLFWKMHTSQFVKWH